MQIFEPEFWGRIPGFNFLGLCFPMKRAPSKIHPQEIHRPKFTAKNPTQNSDWKIHIALLQGHLAENLGWVAVFSYRLHLCTMGSDGPHPMGFLCQWVCARDGSQWVRPLLSGVTHQVNPSQTPFSRAKLETPSPPPYLAIRNFSGGVGVCIFRGPPQHEFYTPPLLIRPPPLEGYFQGRGGWACIKSGSVHVERISKDTVCSRKLTTGPAGDATNLHESA